jgi:DNA repair protein RadA/Sms
MAKTKYRCTSCDALHAKWDAQCPTCKKFNTLEEEINFVESKGKETSRAFKASTGNTPRAASTIEESEHERISTGVGELDRVLGGSNESKGMVKGSTILLAGAPGSGKSTLAGMVAGNIAKEGKNVLYVSGEESAAQVASRKKRINAANENLFILSEVNVANIVNEVEKMKPDFLVIDSIQTLLSPDSEGRVGSPSQVSEIASEVNSTAKRLNIPTILIGHVTKDGNIAGPRVVEHLVDVVLYFGTEGKESALKILRGVKNRFGATDEIGCFQHTAEGLEEISDPSGLLTEKHEENINGYATTILLEGLRALPLEITALVTPSPLPNPRKITYGLENGRVLMIQAILEKYGKVRLNNKDVYVATTGGITAKDSSVDGAIAAAIISSYKSSTIPDNSVFLFEISLTGELRKPKDYKKRIAEAERLGYTKIYMPGSPVKNCNITTVNQLVETI